MQYMNNIFSNVRGLYSSINSTSNSGAIDVIVVEQPDGTFKSTPLRVVFGMLRVIKPKHKPIDVRVNDVPVRLNLYLGDFGEVYCYEDSSQYDMCRSMSSNSLDLLFSSKGEQTLRHSSSETDIPNFIGDEKSEPLLIDDIAGQENEFETYLGQERIEKEGKNIFSGIRMSLCGDLGTLDHSLAISRFNSHLVSFEGFMESPNDILNNKRLIFLFDDKFYTWHAIGPLLVSISIFGCPLPRDTLDSLNCFPPKLRKNQGLNWLFWKQRRNDRLVPDSLETSDLSSDCEPHSPRSNFAEHTRPFYKPNRLTSAQIASLNLKPGLNTATFSVTTSFQGTYALSCRIFLWHHTDKLVISDIDGTITKTDVLGQVLPMVGMSWCHDHVTKMYRAIEDNKYRIIYLSSRSIAQSAATTHFIENVRQDGDLLPKGPIMLSPFGLFQAFNREVIQKCPQKFKIGCLREIADLFPDNCSPIVGGFGNRDTDETTYRALGVSPSRIFIIDSKGKVVIPNMVKLSTRYSTMKDQVDAFFPFRNEMNEEYMNSMYWRLPYRSTD